MLSQIFDIMEQRYCDGHEIHSGDRVRYNNQAGRVVFVADRNEFEPGYKWEDYPSGVMIEFDNGARLFLVRADDLLIRQTVKE